MKRRGSQLLPDKKRLRWILIGFFFALALPTAFLVYQSLDQLKWQSVHQYRGLANELADRIDADLSRRALREANRSMRDYRFFSFSRSPDNGYRLRSALAAFPVVAELPGTIGYFQIDANGEFSTPLLPSNKDDLVGISPAELILRQRLHNNLLQILTANELVEIGRASLDERQTAGQNKEQKRTTRPAGNERAAAAPPRKASPDRGRPQRQRDAQAKSEASRLSTDRSANPAVQRRRNQPNAESAIRQNAARQAGALSGSTRRYDQSNDRATARAGKQATDHDADRLTADAPQAASATVATARKPSSNFDRLSPGSASQSIGLGGQRKRLPRLEELNLDQSLQQGAAGRRRPQAEPVLSPAPAAPSRSAATSPRNDQTGNGRIVPAGATADAIVTAFEREVDPFALSRLNSGHFVLYRTAWQEGQRLIQGMLIDPASFVHEMIRPGFVRSSIAPISDLTVAFGDSVLTTVSGASNTKLSYDARELRGLVLFESALNEPFNNLRLVFSVRELPTNASRHLITWIAVLLALILGCGLYGLYRLGKRRLELASDQQDFVAAVSHELKTPLTSIRMYGEMLREGWASDDKKAAYYDFIHDESERLSRLIDNVLQLASVTRNDINVNLQALTPSQVMDMIQSRTAATISRAGFSFDITDHTAETATSDEPKVQIDPDLFVQVMINLIDNAVKFSAKADKRHLDIAVSRRDDRFCFSVRDYGPGIADSQIRKIFRLFYRAETELTRETVGTGIGLALVSELVRAMNGRVDVVNCSPGARFDVILPSA